MRKYVRFPSPAMIVALLALLVATSGASYAAVKIGTKDLKDEAVTTAKVRDRTLLLKDLDPKTASRRSGSPASACWDRGHAGGLRQSRAPWITVVPAPAGAVPLLGRPRTTDHT